MNIARCFAVGFGRVWRAPALPGWVFLASLAVSLPLTAAMREILRSSFGTSLVQENMRRGFDVDWYGEFSRTAGGLASTFGPSVVGMMPIAANLERTLDGQLFAVDWTVLAAGIAFLLAWAFLAGGIILRLAQAGRARTRGGFFSACGEYFFRFVRLLALSMAIYWALFRWISGPLHRWVERGTRDVTVEFTAMTWTMGVYAVVGLLLVIAGLSFDYAKIAMVLEERRSALLAFVRGLRFFLSHPGRTLGLYGMFLIVGALIKGLFILSDPGVGQAGNAALILAFLVGQCYVLLCIFLKLWSLASQALLFQAAASGPEAAAMALEAPPSSSEVAA